MYLWPCNDNIDGNYPNNNKNNKDNGNDEVDDKDKDDNCGKYNDDNQNVDNDSTMMIFHLMYFWESLTKEKPDLCHSLK